MNSPNWYDPHVLIEMEILYLFIFFSVVNGNLPEQEKVELCENLECDEGADKKVCGVKYLEEEVTFKLFDNECKLLQYGCRVDDSDTFGMISMKHCKKSIREPENINNYKYFNECPDCIRASTDPVCGIRPDGDGFRIRTFENECELNRHNCHNQVEFNVTDFYICANDPSVVDDAENEIFDEEPLLPEETKPNQVTKVKNLVVVDGSMMDKRNIHDSIKKFFATTHRVGLPLQDIQPMLNDTTRRMLIRIFGPLRVYTPWVTVPKNVSDDFRHKPTLNSCYHKCPTKCPDTYAPVCGVPGIRAREPSLMFQNHCYMDVAQCKMFWEGKSDTSESSGYVESSFSFCLGDELNGLYRFLPLIKTLQHMGRMKKKGHFRYIFRNMRFFNNLIAHEPKIMG